MFGNSFLINELKRHRHEANGQKGCPGFMTTTLDELLQQLLRKRKYLTMYPATIEWLKRRGRRSAILRPTVSPIPRR